MPRKRTVWLRKLNNNDYRRYYREEDAKEAVDLLGGGPVYPLEIEE